jgi:hypothetical protein
VSAPSFALNWENTTVTSEMLKKPSGQQITGTQVFQCPSKFQTCVTSTEDAKHSTHPSMNKTYENTNH